MEHGAKPFSPHSGREGEATIASSFMAHKRSFLCDMRPETCDWAVERGDARPRNSFTGFRLSLPESDSPDN
jgi:hypothetical protein